MKLLFENWRKHLKEERISVEDIHKRAEELDIPWDDDAQFMNWTKELTGKPHLDDLTSKELSKVYGALKKRGKKNK
jgi:phage gp16-like protein